MENNKTSKREWVKPELIIQGVEETEGKSFVYSTEGTNMFFVTFGLS